MPKRDELPGRCLPRQPARVLAPPLVPGHHLTSSWGAPGFVLQQTLQEPLAVSRHFIQSILQRLDPLDVMTELVELPQDPGEVDTVTERWVVR